ncbi:hypothetical protein [Streptomyces sp. NPDC001404]|uniref:hypothetical protein n=1 Tax=Streptomyces sp. NPDC001404 TaxID=3364571 RepID=UPI0036A5AA56
MAWWKGKAGNAADAAADFDNLVKDMERVLGPDALETLNARASLALFQHEAGNSDSAVAILTALLVDCRKGLGPNHPQALAVQRILTSWRRTETETPQPNANRLARPPGHDQATLSRGRLSKPSQGPSQPRPGS